MADESAVTAECSRPAGKLEGLHECIGGTGTAVHLSPGSAHSVRRVRSLVLEAHVDWLLEQPLSIKAHALYHEAITKLVDRCLCYTD